MEAPDSVVFVGGKPGNFPPHWILTFPPTGLSDNLGGMERGMGGKGKGGGDLLPYSPHWLLPQIPPWPHIVLSCLDEPSIVVV